MDKHRVAVDFQFPNGAFQPLTAAEPLQLYRVFECELMSGDKASVCVPNGSKLCVLCISGEGAFSSETTSVSVKEQSLVVCECGTYEVKVSASQRNADFLCFVFDVFSQQSVYTLSEYTEMSHWFSEFRGVAVSEHAVEVRRCLRDLLAELSLVQPTMLLVKGYFYQVMIETYRQLVRHTTCQDSRDVEMNAVGQTVYAIVRYIEENLFSINNLMDMAKELGYSYNYLSHLFRRKTGMTIQAYVTQKKIEQSTKLLSDEQYSITEIATMLNYDCIQSFSKAFRRAMGVSQTEYRAKISR